MMTKEMLFKMTVKELRTYVKDNNLQIAKFYELKKDDLVEAIFTVEAAETTEIKEVQETAKPQNNGWEVIAKKQLTGAYNMFIGGLENTLQDYDKEDEEYKNAYATLCSEPEDLINEIYGMAVNCEYGPGYEGPWGSAPKEMKFAGRKFCENFINELLKKDGFCGYSQAYAIPEENAIEEVEALDKAVAEMSTKLSTPTKINLNFTHEDAKPITKPLKNGRTKYTCPVCDAVTKNKYDYCFNCGLLFNHGQENFDKLYELSEKCIRAPKIVIKAGKKKRECPTCSKKIWMGDNFCSYCGQEVLDNAKSN